MKNKRIAFLIEIPTPYRDSFFERLAEKRDFSFEVIYCAVTEYGRDWKQQKTAYPYTILPGFTYPVIGSGIFIVKVNFAVWRRLSEGGYDAIIISGYAQPTMQLAILWCILNKVPYILLSESHNLTKKPFLTRALKWPLVKFAVRRARAFLVMGANSRDYLISYGADSNRIFLLPNAPDVKKIAEQSLEYRLGLKNLREELDIRGNPVIIYAGRLIGIKNVKTILFAFQLAQKAVPGAGLIIAGYGPLSDYLNALARKLKLSNISFTGFIQPDELSRYYACSDVFVLSSLDEPWGVVVLEAMASGLAVVVSDKVGCARDLVYENKSGFVVSPEDIEGFASVFIKLLQNSLLCRQMGEYAQKIVLKYDYDLYIGQLGLALEAIKFESLAGYPHA